MELLALILDGAIVGGMDICLWDKITCAQFLKKGPALVRFLSIAMCPHVLAKIFRKGGRGSPISVNTISAKEGGWELKGFL